MVTLIKKARKEFISPPRLGSVCFALVLFLHSTDTLAAIYGPWRFFVSAGGFFDVINPSEINSSSDNNAKLQGLFGGRGQIERGLFAPRWSHWMEFGYHYCSADTQSKISTGLMRHQQKLTYMSIIPVGVTFWFARTSYIDFGISASAGLGIMQKLSYSRDVAEGTLPSNIWYEGKKSYEYESSGLGFLFDGRISGRFWLGKYFAITAVGGIRHYNSTLAKVGDPVTTIKSNLLSLTASAFVTFAFGGAQGTGRTYVEVLPADPPKTQPKQKK